MLTPLLITSAFASSNGREAEDEAEEEAEYAEKLVALLIGVFEDLKSFFVDQINAVLTALLDAVLQIADIEQHSICLLKFFLLSRAF